MTIKDKEKVLKILIKYFEDHNIDEINSIKGITEITNIPNWMKTLESLKKHELITFDFTAKTPLYIKITTEGNEYFDNKKQEKIDYWKKFAMSHIVNLIASALVAFFAALFAVWLKTGQ